MRYSLSFRKISAKRDRIFEFGEEFANAMPELIISPFDSLQRLASRRRNESRYIDNIGYKARLPNYHNQDISKARARQS